MVWLAVPASSLSLTRPDAEKVKDPANWHVIYSIEGGCPSNTKGNLGDVKYNGNPAGASACESEKDGDCVHSWDVLLPRGVKSGHATLSWTWFNTIGNREMYQNCVAVDITGGTGEEMGSFPPLFVANLASVNECETTAEMDVLFPNPGEYIYNVRAERQQLLQGYRYWCGLWR